MRAFAAVAVLAVLSSTDGFAQVATTPAKPDQARLAAAEEYYTAADYKTDARIYVDVAVDQYAKAIAQRGGKTDVDTEQKVAAMIRPDFEGLVESKHQHMVEIFAEHFSADELQEVVKWIHTPIGMKFKKAKPDIVRELYANSNADTQRLRIKVWTKQLPGFEKLGLTFPGVKQQ